MKKWERNWKKIPAILTCFVLIFALAACGASAPKETAAADAAAPAETWDDGSYDMVEESENGVFQPAAGIPDATKRDAKIVYTANMDLETTAFDQAVSDIAAAVERFDGYFANSSQNSYNAGYRYADYAIKVPKNQFQQFLSSIGEVCHVTYTSTSAEDITDSYYDVDSRLKTAQTKLERLQELLSKADNMSDIITIESAISDAEWEIENLTGTLRTYDNQVDYATVYLSLREVYKLSGTDGAPMTLGRRIGNSFVRGLKSIGNFFENLLVWLAYSWIWLAVIAVIVVVAIRIAKKKGFRIRRRKKDE